MCHISYFDISQYETVAPMRTDVVSPARLAALRCNDGRVAEASACETDAPPLPRFASRGCLRIHIPCYEGLQVCTVSLGMQLIGNGVK